MFNKISSIVFAIIAVALVTFAGYKSSTEAKAPTPTTEIRYIKPEIRVEEVIARDGYYEVYISVNDEVEVHTCY